MSFHVPGYAVAELIGFGGSGEVWRARHEASGEMVALKRLRTGADPATRDRLRREAALLLSLAGPHVVRLRDLLLTDAGPVLVLDHADGGNLARLLAARGPLTPGELLTLGVPLARTLADLHARGVVHGDLSPSNILLTGDGRPMIADLGVARLLGECPGPVEGTEGYLDPATTQRGLAPTPASDVYALALMLVEAAIGSSVTALDPAHVRERLAGLPAETADALARCLDPDPTRRPTAAELATALRALGTPSPLRLPASSDAAATDAGPLPVTAAVTPLPPRPAPPAPRGRGWLALPSARVAVMVPIAGLLLAAAVGGGLLWAKGSVAEASAPKPLPPAAQGPMATSTPSAATSQASWLAVMTGLDAARDDAFVAGDPEALAQVYAPGSSALRLETQRMTALLDQRLVVRDLELRVTKVTPVTTSAGAATLLVTDRMTGYEVTDAAGRVVETRPARPDRTWRVELVHQAGHWLIASVSNMP